jgi:hypothetical protein
MSQYQTLKKRLKKTQYLIADANGNVVLTGKPQALDAMVKESGDSILVQNVARALENFALLHGVGQEDKEFAPLEIATIIGGTQQMVSNYRKQGVLMPSVVDNRTKGSSNPTRYSWEDAFIAGCIGSLRRHRIGTDVLKKIQPLLSDNEKRTPQEGATS